MKTFQIYYQDEKETKKLKKAISKMKIDDFYKKENDEFLIMVSDFYNYDFQFKLKKLGPDKFQVFDFIDDYDWNRPKTGPEILSKDQLFSLIENQYY